MSLNDDLVRFIQQNLVEEGAALRVDGSTSLIDSGIVGSLQLLQLVTFLEERTGVRVPDDEVLPENFETVESMVAMVGRLRARTT